MLRFYFEYCIVVLRC